MAKKVYVATKVMFDADGTMRPLALLWDDEWFEIDRIKDVRQAASLKVGGIGVRFTCEIGNRERYLFYENPSWFLEVEEHKCAVGIT